MADSAADLVDNATSGGPIRREGGVWGPPTSTSDSGAAQTWHRDSHELFDYESQHIYRGKHSLRRSARIYRNGNDVTLDEDGPNGPASQNNTGDYLLSVKARDGKYFVFPADRSAITGLQPRKLWLITRYLPDSQYPLSEGDVIKLGRFKLRIKQIVPEDSYNVLVDYRLDDSADESGASPHSGQQVQALEDQETQNPGDVIQCRICLLEGTVDGEDEDAANPLVRPCQCKGSIMYVHLECLRHWVNGKLNLSEDLSRSCCFVRQIQCELCKATFPSFVTSKGEKLPVVKIPQLQPPFVVLENMVGVSDISQFSISRSRPTKAFTCVAWPLKRNANCISRWHATIKYSNGQFQLEDHSSKFGTLVALRRPVIMDSQGTNGGSAFRRCGLADDNYLPVVDRLSVQVGRTVMDLGIVGGALAAAPEHPSISMVEDITMEG